MEEVEDIEYEITFSPYLSRLDANQISPTRKMFLNGLTIFQCQYYMQSLMFIISTVVSHLKYRVKFLWYSVAFLHPHMVRARKLFPVHALWFEFYILFFLSNELCSFLKCRVDDISFEVRPMVGQIKWVGEKNVKK